MTIKKKKGVKKLSWEYSLKLNMCPGAVGTHLVTPKTYFRRMLVISQ